MQGRESFGALSTSDFAGDGIPYSKFRLRKCTSGRERARRRLVFVAHKVESIRKAEIRPTIGCALMKSRGAQCLPVTPDGWSPSSAGSRKSRSLCHIQSTIRAHLDGIKETFSGPCCQKPSNIGLRSQYSIRLYAWAKKYASVDTKRISLENLRKLLGLESVKDAEGNIIQEAPLPIWANFRQRALDIAIAEITKKTDLKIAIKSLERSKHRRVDSVTFAIKEQGVPEQ